MPAPSSLYSTPASRLRAVLSRDRKAERHFVFAVVTTGVFCRPGCPSRLPREENVCFFDSSDLAVRAGFRACKRCQPDSNQPGEQQAALIAASCRWLEDAEGAPSLQKLADAAGLSRFHFLRVFKAVTGTTPKAYALAAKARRARSALQESGSVTEAIYEAGYSSGSRFYESSAQLLGMLPATYQAGGKGEVINFAVGECSLGFILVAATTKGLCAILLGDNPDRLVRDLCARFPKARLEPGDGEFEKRVALVIGFVEQPVSRFPLPLDLRGTLFQQRVWEALQQLKPGETVTYSELAARLGQPKAVRAVAGACAANALAVAVPCHRVVRVDEGLAGYRWGVERKRALLLRERLCVQPA